MYARLFHSGPTPPPAPPRPTTPQSSFIICPQPSAQQVAPHCVLARSMAEICWVITFETVQDPAQMKVRFDNSRFAKKCSSSVSHIVGSNLVCSFGSILSKQALQKKCLQTFGDYGTFKRYVITQTSGSRIPEFRNSGKWNTRVCWTISL